MKFEKKIANILSAFIAVCFMMVAVLILLYCDFDVLKNSLLEVQIFVSLMILSSILSVATIANISKKDRDLFIKSIISDESASCLTFKECRRLHHAFQMEYHQMSLDTLEKQHLENLLEYKDMEINLTEREIKRLQGEKEYLARSLEQLEKTFISISNHLNEGVWITDPEGTVLFANRYLVRRMRVTVGDHTCGVFNLRKEDCEFFSRRDFKDIELKLWDSKKNKILLSNTRVMYNSKINNIIYLCREKENLEDFIKNNQDFNFIFDTFDALSKNIIDKQSIHNFLEKMCLFGEFKSASVRLIGDDKESLNMYSIHQDTYFVLNKSKLNIHDSHMGLAYRSGSPVLIHGKEDLRMEEPFIKNAVAKGYKISYFPLRIQGIDIGVLSIIGEKDMSINMVQLIKAVCINLTIALEKILIYDTLKNNFFDIIGAFFMALEMKSMHLRGHSARVAMLCKRIAEQLYYTQEEIDNLYSAALLHDVGKLLFLDKSYKHVFDIHEHGYLGKMIMEKIGAREDIIKGIEFHHDDYKSEKGVQPIFSQFVRLANDFDIYFHIKPCAIRAKDFIKKIAGAEQGVYSPNLVNVLENIIDNNLNELLDIYEVANAEV